MPNSEEKTIIKIALLNDLMGLELASIPIDQILNAETKSKLRNTKKNNEILTAHFDEMMNDVVKSEMFGDLCDYVNDFINESLKGK
jgi:hypothetical protein